MDIKVNSEIEMQSFVDSLHRAEFESYTPEELNAFRKGVSCALASLGVDDFTISDFREFFEYQYYTDTAENVCPF